MNCDKLLVTGIGGQGVILLTKIMARTAFDDGVTMSTLETLGGMQRGGPVYVQVRVGPVEFGASVAYGTADAVISLEGYEGLRVASRFLKPGGLVVQNDKLVQVAGHFRTKRKPITTAQLPELFDRIDARLVLVPASELAASVGNTRLENLALFGAVVQMGLLGFRPETARKVIARSVPTGTEEQNLSAFEAGYRWVPAQTQGIALTIAS